MNQYEEEVKVILEAYDTDEIYSIEWGTVDDFAAAVDSMEGDWESDWIYNEDDDYYDFKAWNCDNEDIYAEAKIRIYGE